MASLPVGMQSYSMKEMGGPPQRVELRSLAAPASAAAYSAAAQPRPAAGPMWSSGPFGRDFQQATRENEERAAADWEQKQIDPAYGRALVPRQPQQAIVDLGVPLPHFYLRFQELGQWQQGALSSIVLAQEMAFLPADEASRIGLTHYNVQTDSIATVAAQLETIFYERSRAGTSLSPLNFVPLPWAFPALVEVLPRSTLALLTSRPPVVWSWKYTTPATATETTKSEDKDADRKLKYWEFLKAFYRTLYRALMYAAAAAINMDGERAVIFKAHVEKSLDSEPINSMNYRMLAARILTMASRLANDYGAFFNTRALIKSAREAGDLLPESIARLLRAFADFNAPPTPKEI